MGRQIRQHSQVIAGEKQTVANRFPIVDLAAFSAKGTAGRREIAATIDEVCRDIGFLLITGHGVPQGVIHRMHEVSAQFFSQPLHYKRQWEVPSLQDIGWKGPESSYLADTLTPGADGSKSQDRKESFGMGPLSTPDGLSPDEAVYFSKNVYPDAPPQFREVCEEYYSELEGLSKRLLEIIAVSLGLDDDFFVPRLDRHTSDLVVNYYPAQDCSPNPGHLRAGAHTDFGTITILNTGDDPGGLQVLDKTGTWLDIVPTSDLFVMNIGDLMAQWTNDRWVSTLHRVVNSKGAGAKNARQSIAFFTQPNYHTSVSCLPTCSGPGNPPKYAPVVSGEHISLKLARLRGLAA